MAKKTFPGEPEEIPVNPQKPEIEKPVEPGKPGTPQEDPYREPPEIPQPTPPSPITPPSPVTPPQPSPSPQGSGQWVPIGESYKEQVLRTVKKIN